VKPLKFGDTRIIAAYREFLQTRAHFEIRSVDRGTLLDAAHLRGQLNLRFPDAIHAATAIRAQ
jgi:predicted nucleic acid-binding protein